VCSSALRKLFALVGQAVPSDCTSADAALRTPGTRRRRLASNPVDVWNEIHPGRSDSLLPWDAPQFCPLGVNLSARLAAPCAPLGPFLWDGRAERFRPRPELARAPVLPPGAMDGRPQQPTMLGSSFGLDQRPPKIAAVCLRNWWSVAMAPIVVEFDDCFSVLGCT
jgi:hypothetical protein